jgi:hypothetical protein
MINLLSIAAEVYQKLHFGPVPNLLGDRDVEYSFIAANLPNQKGNVLDFGSGGTPLSLIALLKGNSVTTIDLLKYNYMFKIPVKFIQDDILKTTKLKNKSFDTIINCSSVEHVGLSGRYGVADDIVDGDIQAMSKLHNLLKIGGMMLLTVPVGEDYIQRPYHRIYGRTRLPLLLEKFQIKKQLFWSKSKKGNQWEITSREKALWTKHRNNFYNIGCFILIRKRD